MEFLRLFYPKKKFRLDGVGEIPSCPNKEMDMYYLKKKKGYVLFFIKKKR